MCMKKNVKKLLCVLFVAILCMNLVACGTEYEDTNGEDNYTLETITDENIINMDIGASGLSYEETEVGIIKSSEYSSKNFNGVEQIYQTNFIGKSDVEVYIGTMNVKKGNFKLAIINDGKIIMEVPLDAFGETYRFEDLKGEFAIHVAGESAAFEFYLEVS